MQKNKRVKLSKEEKQRREEKITQAISMVNDVVKLRLAPSPVHGIGVFTIRDIKKGERLYVDAMPCMLDVPYSRFKEIQEEARELILDRFPRIKDDGSHFLAPDTLMQIYLNHSDNPNYDNQTGKALRNIKKGEEVFEDYRNVPNYKKIFDFLKD